MSGSDGAARTALITGAAGGIGQAIAETLARQGWNLVLSDRAGTALDDIAHACRAFNRRVDAVPADVRREAHVAALVAHARTHHGRLDGFVSNAGIAGVVQAVDDYPLDVFEQTMAVNVTGTFLCLKHGLPVMRAAAGGGSFVVMASTSSIRGRAHMAAYVAGKHAVLGLMRTAALEQLGTPLRVNAVLPGPTQTSMIDAINEMAAARSPDGGKIVRAVSAPYGTPQNVAETVAFLLSDASRHMNGAALVLDGGGTVA
jgi:NAD(P)-dependent dehydrogenase (short-subunit alcohol dehydrogenase family)